MKALILAGGFGTRLKEVISDRPKVMAPVGGKPFLEYIIQLLRKNGIKEIVISLGYLGEHIKAYFGNGSNFGVKIEYAVEDFPMGTAGAVKNAQPLLKNSFLVVNGDTYLETDLSKLTDSHTSGKSLVTITLVKRKKVFEGGWVSLLKSGKVKAFIEKPKGKRSGWVSGGYYVFEPEIFKFIPKNRKFSIEKQLFPLLAKKRELFACMLSEDFMDIGKSENYEKVKEYFSHKKEIIVESKAPVRISFAGGGTDLSEYFRQYGGRVFSSTINMFAHVKIKVSDQPFIRIVLKDYKKEEIYPLGKILPYDNGIFDLYKAILNRLSPDLGMDIEVWGDFPAGSGLASSSAVCAAFIAALLKLMRENMTKEALAGLTIEVERDMLKIPGGWQDQYATVFGGFNLIDFLQDGSVKVKNQIIPKNYINKLESGLQLFYLGAKRTERDQQSSLRKNIKTQVNLESMKILKILAVTAAGFVKKGKLKDFGTLLDAAWQAKKATSANISDSRIDRIYDTAINSGAYGGKLLGAGGGGCLLICAPRASHSLITRNLKRQGVIRLPLTFEFEGTQAVRYES